MDIYQQILDLLRREYAAGATYQELADKHNISYPYIRSLMRGDQPVEKLSLETFLKMFPAARISLRGDTVEISAADNRGTVVGVNHGGAVSGGADAVIDRILRSDLSAEDKVKFIELMRK